MRKLLRLLPLLLFLSDACVDPLKINIAYQPNGLVFDGQITNDPGPYQIKIFYAGPFDGFSLQKSVPERKANVWINSDAGESEKLIESAPGIYQTSATGIRGQVGRSYSMQVQTASGKTYSTAPQQLNGPGQINNLYVEFERNSLLLNGQSKPTDAFLIYVDARGDGGSNLYRWRYANTFKAETHPELHLKITVAGPVPDPLPCSGYVANGAFISKVGDCTCCICYGTEYNNNSIVSTNKFSKDAGFNKVLIAKLPVTWSRFYERYYIAVDQLSISQDVHEFWKLAEALQKSTGSLFQPNSVKVKGNITCTSNPDETALGVFEVSGITKRTLSISRNEVTIPIPPTEIIMYDCRESFINATTAKPPFW